MIHYTKTLNGHEWLRRPCDKCGKMFRKNGKFTKICIKCQKNTRKNCMPKNFTYKGRIEQMFADEEFKKEFRKRLQSINIS